MIGNFHELQIWHLNHTSIWHKNLNYIILGDHSPITAKISYTNYSSCSFIRNNLMKQIMLSSSINNTPVLAPLATDLRQHLTFEIIRSSSLLILYQSPSLSFPDHLYPPRFPPHQSAESVSDKDKNKTLDEWKATWCISDSEALVWFKISLMFLSVTWLESDMLSVQSVQQ